MENLKGAIVVLLVVLFFGRSDAEDVIECGIVLKVPCKCGDQEGVQDVWAPSCKAQNSTKKNNCVPCPGACEPFSKCKTCSESGCLTCPEGKFGQFCDSVEPQVREKAQKTKDEAPISIPEKVENPLVENISTPKEEIGFQDTKLKMEAKDQHLFDKKSPFWQTLDLLSDAEKEKVMFKTFLRGDVSVSDDKDPAISVTKAVKEILNNDNEPEEPSEESEDTTSNDLIQSEELPNMESVAPYRIIVEQPQPVEEILSNNDDKLDVFEEEENPSGTQIISEDGGVVGSKIQPEEEKDWADDFEPETEKEAIIESEDNPEEDSTDEKGAEEAIISEQGIEEIPMPETTNMTELENQPGEQQYRQISNDDLDGVPESTNASASSSSESIHLNNLMKFPIPLKGLVKGLVKLEMLVTSLVHLNGDSKSDQLYSNGPAAIGLSPELRLPQGNKGLLDSLASCNEHPEVQSRRLFLYMYDPHFPKIAHVHLFNISEGPNENQSSRAEVNNQSKDNKANQLSFREQNTQPKGFEQVMNPPTAEQTSNPLPLVVNNRPPLQNRQPFVNALESKAEIGQPSNSKSKQRVMNLDKLMNFPSIKTRHEPVLFAPDSKKQDRRPSASGQRSPQSGSKENDQKTQDAENPVRKPSKGRPRKRVPLKKQSEKIRIKVVNDENANEFSELLITQKRGDTKKGGSGENIFVPVPGGSKGNVSDRNPDNASRIRKHLFRLKREDSDWCPIQKTFRNGDLDCTIWSYQKICTLTCHPGFTAPNIYKCVPRGEWDPPLKSCMKIKKQKKANPPYRSLETGKDEPFPSYDGDFNDEEFEALMYD